jgi:hypothetical protein
MGRGKRERKKKDMRREQIPKRNLKRRKRVVTTLRFEGELGNKLVLGAISCGYGFHYKMINKDDK